MENAAAVAAATRADLESIFRRVIARLTPITSLSSSAT
jgi:hypothetical protein